MSEGAARLRPRVALISIAAFWALYFTILTIRALLVYQMHSGMGKRAIVSIASMGITALFYVLIRRIPIRRLGVAIATAAVLAVPAAIVYATVNYRVFEYGMKHVADAGRVVKPSSPAAPPHPAALPGAGRTGAVAPPAPPTALSVGPAAEDERMAPWQSIADQAANGYFFFASWAALYLALCYAGEAGRLARRAAALEAAARSAELMALRYQVNQHFLFNTLNSLSSLVLSGQSAEAERMILNLSTFFRSSLVGDPTEDVPLIEEIQLQRLYLDIEAIRFPERLRVAIDLPDALARACVPGLILQPLVENAIKHGVARARRPVLVQIRAHVQDGQLVLDVENDGDAGPANSADGTGVGLVNVRDRLQARFGDAARSEWAARGAGGFAVTLTMPLTFDGC